MRPLLWFVFLVALGANIASSNTFDGTQEVLASVATGSVSLAAGLGLLATRRRPGA
ncbi:MULTISPECIES: hypothetical protein [unclassified Streptomyces]|uniref:hypothetical protein n=1 Tax=unclassified Streptomyces TaxID=2593676 RepID=UPI0033B668C9